MANEKTALHRRIEAGKPLLLAEVSPPIAGDPAPLGQLARRYAGKVHAVGIADNRHGVCMSALAAASLVSASGVEPILHVTTRDRNRIALLSECLGAAALGIRNLLCTSGTHQTLCDQRAAKNVFDVDSIQLLQMYADLQEGARDSGLGAGEIGHHRTVRSPEPQSPSPEPLAPSPYLETGPLCLAAAAAVYADPLEMQVMRLAKKAAAGAVLLITQPIFDLERFDAWFAEVTRRGIHDKVAITAGIQPLVDAEEAKALAEKRPRPVIPDAVLKRLAAGDGKSAQRAVGIEIAVETIKQLSQRKGLRGFEIRDEGRTDVALEVIEKAGLEID